MPKSPRCLSLVTVFVALSSAAAFAAGGKAVWDIGASGRFDETDKAYRIVDGRVTVDLAKPKSPCPKGLGNIATGIDVREIAFEYEASAPSECVLQVSWTPGGSGAEQFEVLANGRSLGKSDLIDGAQHPYRYFDALFPFRQNQGPNELVLRALSGDGLHFKTIALKSAAETAAPEEPAGPGKILWDLGDSGRFDPSNKVYDIVDGRVTVDLSNEKSLCPTGLGNIAEGRPDVRDAVLKFNSDADRDAWLHVTWNPGGSGDEQFEVSSNNAAPEQSELVVGGEHPYQNLTSSFKVALLRGENGLLLHVLSGNGLHFDRIALTTGPGAPSSQTVSADAPFAALSAYEASLGERGVMLDSDHLRLFAPKRRETDARRIMDYLIKAYDELYRIVGVHTPHKIVVYHFPPGHPYGWGGTSTGRNTIEYGTKNLELSSQPEWLRYSVPHLSGYIEEMAHNFVKASGATFGWEMVGWSIGEKVTSAVAGNPILAKAVEATRKGQQETFRRYRAAGNVFPSDLPPNQVDRIHAWILYQCEKAYGPGFWPDFFTEIRKDRERLLDPGVSGDTEERNARYRITIDCFDRLKGVSFKKMLSEAGISLTTDVNSLEPEKPGWNRKLQ